MTDSVDLGYSKLLIYGTEENDLPLSSLTDALASGSSGTIGTATTTMNSNMTTDLVDPSTIDSGDMLSQLTLSSRAHIKGGQTAYNAGTGFFLGWESTTYKFSIGDGASNYMTWDGTTLSIGGTFSAGAIDIGGADATSFHVDASGNMWLGAATFAGAPFTVSNAGVLTATGAIISGTITATSGTIGGFTIGTDYFRDAANSFGLASTVTGGDDVRFWAGDTFANRATAPFRVTEAGAVTATNITITGGSVLSSILAGIIAQANLDVSNRGWGQTCAFTVTDADTVAWGAGTFTDAAGTAYSIGASNTGNMVAKTYIYLDTIASITAYQTTTTSSTAVGTGKVLVAIAQNGTGEATFTVLDGQGGQNIDAANIVAGSITANEIAASTITAGKMSVSQLSAIAADLGAITAGTIVLPSGGYIRSGQTAYNTGTGFYLGNDSGTTKFSIGDATLNFLTWNGTTFSVSGGINPQITAVAGENLTVGDPVCIRTNEIVKQVASHDARVLESSAGTNYGTATTAVIGSTNATNNGDSYLFVKFDLSTITIPIADSAMIRLYVVPATMTAAGSSYQIGIFQVTGADWDESTITWTNKPAIGAIFEDWELSNGDSITDDFIEESSAQYIYLDVTTLFNQWKAGSQSDYGVCIRWTQRSDNLEPAATTSNVEVATSEHATAAFRPTIIVSGVSENIGKAYKANATNFTDLFGEFGICMATVSAAATATIQTGGKVSNQSGLTPGQTYYVTDSETLSTTPGTLVREVGIALSATEMVINSSFSRVVTDVITYNSNDSTSDHDSTNTLFIPLGFKPKLITFEGTTKAGGAASVHTAIGKWQNAVQQTILVSNSSPIVTSAYLAYDVPGANESATLTVTSESDSGVKLTFQLKDNTTSDSSYVSGVLTFTR